MALSDCIGRRQYARERWSLQLEEMVFSDGASSELSMFMVDIP